MATSDGISMEDWDRVHELALAIVNAEDDSSEELVARKELLDYLDELHSKYGARPSLLATRADYLDDDVSGRLRLLEAAYALASEADDVRNQLLIATSLADLYVGELRDSVEGGQWLSRLDGILHRTGDDVERAEVARIRADWRRLRDDDA